MEPWKEELYHHGILGMRWGVRRYQNADGSLTSAGKKRYYNNKGFINEEGRKANKYAKKHLENDINKQYNKLKKRAEKDENFREQLAAHDELRKASDKKLMDAYDKEVRKRDKIGEEKYGYDLDGHAFARYEKTKEAKAYTKSYKELESYGKDFVQNNMKSKIFTKAYIDYYNDGKDINYGKRVAEGAIRKLEREYATGRISNETLSKPTFNSKMADHYQNKADKADATFNKISGSGKTGTMVAIKKSETMRKGSEYRQIANLYRERDKKKRSK